ncbi:MAG: hypothetical protein V7752_07210 [Halopseudomonas sp.]
MSKVTKALFVLTDIFAWLFIASGIFSTGYLVLMDEAEISLLTEQFRNWGLSTQIALITLQSIGFYLMIRRSIVGLVAAIAPSVALYLPVPTLEGLVYLLLFVLFFVLPWCLSYLQFSKRGAASE